MGRPAPSALAANQASPSSPAFPPFLHPDASGRASAWDSQMLIPDRWFLGTEACLPI